MFWDKTHAIDKCPISCPMLKSLLNDQTALECPQICHATSHISVLNPREANKREPLLPSSIQNPSERLRKGEKSGSFLSFPGTPERVDWELKERARNLPLVLFHFQQKEKWRKAEKIYLGFITYPAESLKGN